jgi:hypothetical protein
VPTDDRLAVDCRGGRELARALEDLRENARPRGSDMENDEDGCGEVGGQRGDEIAQRLHSTCGCADDDEVLACRRIGWQISRLPPRF